MGMLVLVASNPTWFVLLEGEELETYTEEQRSARQG